MRECIDKLFTVGMAIIGALLIIFRKSFVRSSFKNALKKAKSEEKEQFNMLGEIGYGGWLFKIVEVLAIIAGMFLLTSSITDLIFPAGQKYIGLVFMFFVLSLFAAGVACLFILKLILPVLNRKVNRYMSEKYAQLYLQSKSPSLKEKYEVVKSVKQIDDPVLRRLRRRAVIYAIPCFAALTLVFLLAFYAIIKVTS